MKITEKIKLDYHGLIEHGPINIVVFGDSVSHGSVGPGEINYETVYWNRLRQKIRNYVPVNVINAAIGGITAGLSLERFESQVLSHNPDLLIICFGLNDVNGSLEGYLDPLRVFFEKGKESGAQVIFMTPNMLNTYVADDVETIYKDYAFVTAQMQNEGKMDLYIESAVKLAKEMGIEVCDCYSKWKELSKTQDVTMLLANRINHPTKEMHELFAQSLFELIFEGSEFLSGENDSTMYRGN